MEMLQLFSPRSDQHVAHEESMVSTSAHHADAYPVALVPASISVNNINAVPGVEVIDRTFAVDAPDLDGGVSESQTEDSRATLLGTTIWDVAGVRCGAAEPQRRHVQGCGKQWFSIGYVPSVHDVCRQISQANFLRNVACVQKGERKVVGTYVGTHRLIDGAPPDIVF
jgi:hypothetical protein